MPFSWSSLVVSSLLFGVGTALSEAEAAAIAGSYAANIKVVKNPAYAIDVVEQIEVTTRSKVEAFIAKKVAAGTNNNCTLENAGVRREWADLRVDEREDYVRAVKCLMAMPARAPKDRFPGAISRWDDFVAYHMTHAAELHDNYHLFPAHKHFMWVLETALRNECGYKSWLPYMNYDRIARDLVADGTGATSPHFNGNSSSLGGTGDYDPLYTGVGSAQTRIPSGGGGGCIKAGHPFSEYNPFTNGTALNKRCLRRDLNKNAALGATADRVYKLMQSQDIDTFYNMLLTPPRNLSDPYNWGVHSAGHYINAVDPGGDPMTSPGDPVFHFHHAALDRLWWMWQLQDIDNRLYSVPLYGTVVPMNMDHGGDMGGMGGMSTGEQVEKRQRVTDPNKMVIDLEWLSDIKVPLLEAHDQLGGNRGQFCYIYV
ncbi:tyrosinase [Echria macrotheca]|uniref:Tyrosinase n=1 Tax=Echria macrotheca TaxID=438768 RepID=A0AAJ0B3L8_9PEZI|nr:tyrosinase [Echria macrotheca]